MKVISIKQNYETDHSSRDYGYIKGVKVYYDFGNFNLKFMLPYNTDLFKKIKNFSSDYLEISKKFNKIIIELSLYSENLDGDPDIWADLAIKIGEEIQKENFEVLKLLQLYYTDKDQFNNFKTKTEISKKLQKVLTPVDV